MAEKRVIPKEILNELNIKEKVKKKPLIVKLIVEKHQARIPIPKRIMLMMNLKKNECEMEYNKSKKELVCKFK